MAGVEPSALVTLRKRKQFLAAAKARKAVTGSMILQDRTRRDDSPKIGVGFTASKKVGNAVARNRAKRRMRAVARDILGPHAQPGHDYVLIARKDATIGAPYQKLCADLADALSRTGKSRPA